MPSDDNLISGATSESAAKLREAAERRRSPDDGYGGAFACADAKAAFEAILGERRRAEKAAEEAEGDGGSDA